jgi:hypothetical protein
VESALFDFAEAAMGKNTAMSWSLSADVLRRQVAPVFNRCSKKELTAEEALDVALDFVGVRVSTMLDTFNDLFTRLTGTVEQRMPGEDFPALSEMNEVFLGLNSESQWATDSEITRRELRTLFQKVYAGEYSTKTGVWVFCDVITSKKEYYLDLIHGMFVQLTEEINERLDLQSLGEPERLANDDD